MSESDFVKSARSGFSKNKGKPYKKEENEEDCTGIKNDGGVLQKNIREIEILCLAGNIPESIDIDSSELALGQSIKLTEIGLPEGAEIQGLTEETDQMVISVNAPRAEVVEEPLEEAGAEDSSDDSDESTSDGDNSEEEGS